MINYPDEFSCYDYFNDMSNERINEIIEELIERLIVNEKMGMTMRNCENTGIIVFKQTNKETKEVSFKVTVMKNHWEKIIPLEDVKK